MWQRALPSNYNASPAPAPGHTMRSRHLWPLSVLVALLLLAAWQLLLPEPAAAPRIEPFRPASSNAGTDSAGGKSVADTPPAILARPPHPPAPPEVVSDPKKGTIWLRVIHDDTNQPLSNTECELWLMKSHREYSVAFDGKRPEGDWSESGLRPLGVRSTDADGLISLSAATHDGRNSAVPKTDVVLDSGWDSIACIHPVPQGFQPWSEPLGLLRQIEALFDQPADRPIDARVRPRPGISGLVTDEHDQPLAGASVYAFQVESPPESHCWAILEDASYSLAQAWSGSDERTISVPATSQAINRCLAALRRMSDQARDPNARFLPAVHLNSLWGGPQTSCGRKHRSVSGTNGRFELPDLLHGQWVVCAWSSTRTMVHQLASLPTAQPATLRLGPPSLGSVRLLTRTFGEVAGDDCYVRCNPIVEFGHVMSNYDGYAVRITRDDNTSEFKIVGLSEGRWLITVNADGWTHNYTCEIVANGTTDLAVSLGTKAFGLWKPYLRDGGTMLQGAWFKLLVGHGSVQDVRPEWPDDGTEPEPQQLASGEYVAWVPGLPPQRFTLAPGEVRTDVFTAMTSAVTFTIEKALVDLLGGWGEPESASLEIAAATPWERLHLLPGLNDDDEDRVSPSKPLSRRLIAGDYQWTLGGYMQGTFSVGPGPNTLHFGMHGMPGLARLDISVVGASEDSPGSIGVYHVTYCAAVRGELVPEPARPRDKSASHPNVHSFDHGSRHIVFAPPGSYVVWAKTGGDSTYCLAKVPGSLSVDPRGPQQHTDAEGTLILKEDGPDGVSHRVLAIRSYLMSDYVQVPGTEPVVAGPLRLCVTRFQSGVCTGYATKDLVIRAGETETIELNTLDYGPPGTLTIRCKGRGAPGRPIDPWWSLMSGRQPGVAAVEMHGEGALPLPSLLQLTPPDEVLPGNRFEFAYNRRVVPPGTYTIIPWPDAPARFHRTVTVKPGEHALVEIDTGR